MVKAAAMTCSDGEWSFYFAIFNCCHTSHVTNFGQEAFLALLPLAIVQAHLNQNKLQLGDPISKIIQKERLAEMAVLMPNHTCRVTFNVYSMIWFGLETRYDVV